MPKLWRILLSHTKRIFCWVKFIWLLSPELKIRVTIDLLINSKSQLGQDVFVAAILKYKREGYFVEFGATDGVLLSNTFFLEKKLNWSGLLSEPGKSWQLDLLNNRSCKIDNLCIWSQSGTQLLFLETQKREFSTISDLATKDHHSENRKNGREYLVETLTLDDFLARNSAPSFIDFISVDTEGSEYSIFENFNFADYRFGIIACEHNFGINKPKLEKLFELNGYIKISEHMSLWDGWYVSKVLLDDMGLLSKAKFPFRRSFIA
jgi:FkbM family methyltransferase